MADENNEYLGDFGGVPKEAHGHGQAADEARSKPFEVATKAVQSPPATKAIQAPPETK